MAADTSDNKPGIQSDVRPLVDTTTGQHATGGMLTALHQADRVRRNGSEVSGALVRASWLASLPPRGCRFSSVGWSPPFLYTCTHALIGGVIIVRNCPF